MRVNVGRVVARPYRVAALVENVSGIEWIDLERRVPDSEDRLVVQKWGQRSVKDGVLSQAGPGFAAVCAAKYVVAWSPSIPCTDHHRSIAPRIGSHCYIAIPELSLGFRRRNVQIGRASCRERGEIS